ncbi:AMP-binding protein [Mesobacillus maritimus]|uniref:AMP-binding protein n=1 Tax=Mesobacillus maritimus TaxID=1643336 RepID=UPI00203E0943|nr:AMP-binding protein [Mesobacillus maritimus]MCM3584997.1 AMP-binding protein [Mesobacillus maritimus]
MKEKDYLNQLNSLWNKNWPANLPKEANYPFGEKLITEYLSEWAEIHPNKTCLIWYGHEITYKQLDDLSSKFASYLAEKGLQKGDRVAVFLPTSPQFHIVFCGILKLGCIHVPVNPMFKEQELLYELNDTSAKLIVTTVDLYPLVEKVRKKTSLQEVISTRIEDFLPDNPTIPVHPSLLTKNEKILEVPDLMKILDQQSTIYPKYEISLDDVAALNYTGGTTGVPKGCEHTQRHMVYTCATVSTFTNQYQSEDIVLAYLPSFWIAGQGVCVLMPIFTGVTHIILGRWDAEAVLQAIEKYKVTHTGGILDNFVELMNREDIEEYDLSSIRDISVASFVKKMNIDYRKKWKELSGSTMREMAYGMTETCTFDTFTTGLQENDLDLKGQPVFVGIPMPGTEMKIVDFESGKLVPLGSEGEIVIRTPSLLTSYWNKPEETEKALRNGWLHTGDVGLIDEDGFVHFLGRRKEMLKVKGMSVSPPEIESILSRHPAVIGCGVIGKEHEEKGEIPVAFVQLNPDYQSAPSKDDLQNWCKEQMAVYKVPVVIIIEELPLTATGKVKKEELKKLLYKMI